MGLYTKKVKEVTDTPVKEVKKKGRPKKVVAVEASELEGEPPKIEEPVPEVKEVQKEPVPVEQPSLVEKTLPPPEPVEDEPQPLKKTPFKKKEVKKVEKKATPPKEDKPPAWFTKYITQIGQAPTKKESKESVDLAKDMASKLWNDRVKPKTHKPEATGHEQLYGQLYKQIFGR